MSDLSQELAELQKLSILLREKKISSPHQVFRALEIYDRLTAATYQARRKGKPFESWEDQLAELSLDWLQHRKIAEPSLLKTWYASYRRIWREEQSLFFLLCFLFIASSLAGWLLIIRSPELATYLLPQEFRELIIPNRSWFSDIDKMPFWTWFSLATHNIKVAVMGFCWGVLAAVGSLYIVIMNGIHLGSVFAYCSLYNFDKPLADFVLSHGPLEMSVIVASCFAGAVMGRSFFERPFLSRFGYHASRGFTLIMGIWPWLIVAGFFEAFASPNEDLSITAKLISGGILALLFWAFNWLPLKEKDSL